MISAKVSRIKDVFEHRGINFTIKLQDYASLKHDWHFCWRHSEVRHLGL